MQFMRHDRGIRFDGRKRKHYRYPINTTVDAEKLDDYLPRISPSCEAVVKEAQRVDWPCAHLDQDE